MFYAYGTLYVAGTRLDKGFGVAMEDLLSDAALPFVGVRYTPRYLDAAAAVQVFNPTRLVGHSLGGAIVAELGHDYAKRYVAYGTPSVSMLADPFGTRRSRLGDFVSAFDGSSVTDASLSLWPHSYPSI